MKSISYAHRHIRELQSKKIVLFALTFYVGIFLISTASLNFYLALLMVPATFFLMLALWDYRYYHLLKRGYIRKYTDVPPF